MDVRCPYCSNAAKQVSGRDVYPHRRDLYAKQFWHCQPCDAYVGTHPDGSPLGRLANRELRRAKMRAHAMFDPLWKDVACAYGEDARDKKSLMRLMRNRAYEWLANTLGIAGNDCHIGMFDVQQCGRVCDVIREHRATALLVRNWSKNRKAMHAAQSAA